MKFLSVLIACLSLTLVAMTMFSRVTYATSPDGEPTEDEDKRSFKNPCYDVTENTTVSTPEGLVFCIVPSEEELIEQLKSVGGYNRHYVAVTQEEAQNFEPLLPGWDGAATTRPTLLPPNRRCRRHRRRPSFRKRRYWKRSAGMKKLGWVEEEHDPEGQEPEKNNEEIHTKRSYKNVYSETSLMDEDDELERSKREFDQEGIKKSTELACQSKGVKVDRYYLMCDQCQLETELESDRFPHFINEVTCASTTSGSRTTSCNIRTKKVGSCVQGYLLINLLVKSKKHTIVNPPSGDYFTALKQVWVPYTHKIRSCCECRSYY